MSRESVEIGHTPRGTSGHLAVPVEIVAMPKGSVRRRRAELRVDHPEAVDNHPVISGLDPKAYQFEETGVSHLALVDGIGTAIPEAIGGADVRHAVFGQTQVVRPFAEGPVGGHHPFFQLRLPGVGCS